MERPIVVNSVLCFIHNFRSLSNLRILIQRSFSADLVEEAKSILLRRTSHLEAVHLPKDVVDLYDVFNARENIIFATADLSQLPLTLTPSNDCLEVLKEIQSLRSYITDTLEGKPEEGSQHRDSITPIARCKLNTSASSPEFPTPVSQGPSPVEEDTASSKATTPTEDAPLSINLSQNAAKRKAARSLDDTVKKLCAKFQPEGDDQQPMAVPTWTSSVDPQTYLNMIRMMQSTANPGNLFGSMIGQIQRLSGHAFMHQDSIDEKDENLEDGESSPSPSEEIKDDFPLLEMSVDNDSDKPFICEHSNCQKRFANKFLLKKHQFIHTGLRPHTCPFCNKRFNRKDNLLRHKKTHMQNGTAEDSALKRAGLLPEAICGLISNLAPQQLLQDFQLEVAEEQA